MLRKNNLTEVDMTIDKLSYAVQLAKAGKKGEALPLLKEIVRADPDNETGWLWMYSCVATNAQKIDCLQQALRINPYNQNARRALEKLTLQDQDFLYSLGKPAVQNVSNEKQKIPQDEGRANPPGTNKKKNYVLGCILISVIVCVMLCGSGLIYAKNAPAYATSTPTSLPPSRTPRPTLTPEPTLPPDLIITYDNVCLAPKNTEVTIKGYLYFMGSTELTDGEYRIALSQKPEDWNFDHPYAWDAQVFLFIKQGNEPNQMQKLPKYRYITDLKVITDNGKVIGHGTPVEITGTMWLHYSGEAKGCAIRVTKVVAR